MSSAKTQNIDNGSVYHINYGRTFHPELKSKHLGVLYNIDTVNNMMLCLPMTSPKEKHFKTIEAFNNRDYRNLKYPHLYYVQETDSIVLLEQFRTISKNRIESQYKNSQTNERVVLSQTEQEKLKKAFLKIVKNIVK